MFYALVSWFVVVVFCLVFCTFLLNSSNNSFHTHWPTTGGCCTACLLPVDVEANRSSWFSPERAWASSDWRDTFDHERRNKKLNSIYDTKHHLSFSKKSPSYKSRDVDLFLYGLNEAEAFDKIRQIHQSILQTSTRPPIVIVNGKLVVLLLFSLLLFSVPFC